METDKDLIKILHVKTPCQTTCNILFISFRFLKLEFMVLIGCSGEYVILLVTSLLQR